MQLLHHQIKLSHLFFPLVHDLLILVLESLASLGLRMGLLGIIVVVRNCG
jgi:hypothetical protein